LVKTKKTMCKIVIANVLSGHIILFIAVFSMIQKQYELLDICIIYVLLGFAATFALTSFMKKYDIS
ncbi:MAG: MrpF/PhaF family protein, partial [Candidatus Heimdallarchaeota archaeon]|nr:MrpF/PhaF family protein [Candidatus Heimdallarchaeota archaeon]